jgi:hypothetical protein
MGYVCICIEVVEITADDWSMQKPRENFKQALHCTGTRQHAFAMWFILLPAAQRMI